MKITYTKTIKENIEGLKKGLYTFDSPKTFYQYKTRENVLKKAGKKYKFNTEELTLEVF